MPEPAPNRFVILVRRCCRPLRFQSSSLHVLHAGTKSSSILDASAFSAPSLRVPSAMFTGPGLSMKDLTILSVGSPMHPTRSAVGCASCSSVRKAPNIEPRFGRLELKGLSCRSISCNSRACFF